MHATMQVIAGTSFNQWLWTHLLCSTECAIGSTARAVFLSCCAGESPAELRQCYRVAVARWDGAADTDILGDLTEYFDKVTELWREEIASRS